MGREIIHVVLIPTDEIRPGTKLHTICNRDFIFSEYSALMMPDKEPTFTNWFKHILARPRYEHAGESIKETMEDMCEDCNCNLGGPLFLVPKRRARVRFFKIDIFRVSPKRA